MMATAKSGKKTIGIWGIVCVLVISACLLVSLIQSQEAYAEKKKIFGTFKRLPRLASTRIPIANVSTKGFLNVYHSVLSSPDPDWNNARFFYIIYSEPSKDYDYKGYGSITHPGGDQTFIEFVSKRTSASGADTAGEIKGFFIGGTGKLEGIRARWLLKWTVTMTEGMMGEWEVEYF